MAREANAEILDFENGWFHRGGLMSILAPLFHLPQGVETLFERGGLLFVGGDGIYE